MTKNNAKARPFYRRALAVCALSGVLVSTVGSAAFAAPTADSPTHKTNTVTSSRVTFDKAGVPSTIKSVQEIERIALKHAAEKNGLRLSAAKQDAIDKRIAAKKAQIAKHKAVRVASIKARAAAKAAHEKSIRDTQIARAAKIAAAKKAAALRVATATKASASQPVSAPKPALTPAVTPTKVAATAPAAPATAKVPTYTTPKPVAVPRPVAPSGVTAPVTAPKPAPVTVAKPTPTPAPVASTSSKAAKIASAALAQIGVKQDCTMLVTNSLKSVGINFRGWPADYMKLGTVTTNPVPGDLIYYRDGGMGMAHIAVYIGNGKAVHGGWNGNDTQIFYANLGSGPVYIHVR